MTCFFNKQDGSLLLGVILAIGIIALVFYGGVFFSHKQQSVLIYKEVEKDVEKNINLLNKQTKDKQIKIDNILNNNINIATSSKGH